MAIRGPWGAGEGTDARCVPPVPDAGSIRSMSKNLRESFRVGGEADIEAELFHEGKVAPCLVINLSAGGAKVISELDVPAGSQCTLGIRLTSKIKGWNEPYVSFLMEVLQVTYGLDGRRVCRLKNMTAPGTADYEMAAKLVFEAQRRLLAKSTGTDAASPMVSDEARRAELRPPERPRYSKDSLQPGQGD